jgi:hypothetical protein
MPWRESKSIPFTRIDIVARVPSDSGVYGIFEGECCIFIGESWNLKARLLELANVLTEIAHLTITYELCSDDARTDRKLELTNELLADPADRPPPVLNVSGISFSSVFNR